ncbi:hypothetical protein DL764_005947 [Monosporascus ibericus]|uniref:Uncharacterized protein n=1 Tax=Monosporascus ibericus TaxID=155417 RepID=A0A4Q4T8V0_9PEZI|nr:hypothetical protein DL764_005947 [Monosporascus ibericus]
MPAVIVKIPAHRAPSADKLSLLSEQLKRLTLSELREVILALCIAGPLYRAFYDEVFQAVESYLVKKGFQSARDGLPPRLFDFGDGELQGVILEVAEKSEIACKRAKFIAEKIIGADIPKPEQVKKAKRA